MSAVQVSLGKEFEKVTDPAVCLVLVYLSANLGTGHREAKVIHRSLLSPLDSVACCEAVKIVRSC